MNPIEAMILGRQQRQQYEMEKMRQNEAQQAITRRNKLDELYQGTLTNPQVDRNQVVQQAGQAAGFEGAQQAQQWFDSLDERQRQQAKAEVEGIARQIAELDAIPDPQQRQAAYQQRAAQLGPEWAQMPYEQAKARIVAQITPIASLFSQQNQAPKVVGAGGALVSPTGEVLFQAPNRPQAPVRGQVVTDPTTGAVYTIDPVTGQARPVTMGGGQSGAPTMDALIAEANRRVQSGESPEAVDAWLQSQAQQAPNVQVGDGQLRIGGGRDQVRTLTKEELAQYGLSPETVAQVDSTGKINIVSQPDAAARKATREANIRLPTIKASIRRLERISDAVEKLSNNPTFIPGVNTGPIDQFVVGMTEAANELESSVAQLQPALLSLTRVPGIGAQSDLEARMAALQFPTVRNRPEVNRRNVAELQAFMRDLAIAYSNIGDEKTAKEIEGLLGNMPGMEGQMAAPNNDIDALVNEWSQ